MIGMVTELSAIVLIMAAITMTLPRLPEMNRADSVR